MSARACQAAYYPGPCAPEGPVWDVVYTSSNTPGKVLDRTQVCHPHGLAVVQRHHVAAGMALVELVPAEPEPMPAEEAGSLPGDFVVIDLSDQVALQAALVTFAQTYGLAQDRLREALRTAGTEVQQLDDEERVVGRAEGAALGHTRERWAGAWDER